MRSLFSIPVFTPDDIVAGDFALPITPAPALGADAAPVAGADAGADSSAALPTATKPQLGLYWVLTSGIETEKGVEKVTGGAFDLYIVESNGDIFRIEQPSGKKEEATNKEEIERALSRPQETTVSKDKKHQFIAKQLFSEKPTPQELKIIARVHNCYHGHSGNTCGWTTLASAIALLAYKLNIENVKIDKNPLTIEIPGFTGKIELKTGSNNDFENRKALATWLEKNQELLVALAPSLNNEGPENFFEEITRISKLEKITSSSDYLTHQILGVVDKDLTLEKILKAKSELEKKEIENKSEEERRKFKEELQNKYEKNKFGIQINWQNITIEDVAILALLSAFLAVISGPGALALPVLIAAFRAISIEKGLDLDGKVDFPKPNTSPDPKEATQVVKESQKQKDAGATAGAG